MTAFATGGHATPIVTGRASSRVRQQQGEAAAGDAPQQDAGPSGGCSPQRGPVACKPPHIIIAADAIMRAAGAVTVGAIE